MMNEKKLQLIFQTLGDANRIRIIRFLGDKERSVNEIVEELALSQPLVSHHLKVLKNNFVLETVRKGPFVFYKMTNIQILTVLDLLSAIFNNADFE